MKRKIYIGIILILILFFILYKNNSTILGTQDNSDFNKNLPSNIINGSYLVYDEDYIYYINQEDYNKLYKIDIAGKKSELVYNGNAKNLFIKDNNIFFINKTTDENNAIKNKLYSIEKNEENLKCILTEDEILSYSIIENTIYYITPSEINADYIIPFKIHNLYSYNINSNEKNLIFENVACPVNSPGIFPIITNENKMYFGIFNLNAGILDYEYVKYNIASGSYKIISKFSPKSFSENSIFFSYKNDLELQCIYSMNIDDDDNTLKTIYKSDNITSRIMKIIVTNEYLFVMIVDDIYNEKLNLSILRMKHDGSNIVKITEMNLPSFGSYFSNWMQVVEDKLIICKYDENWHPSIIVTDIHGNILNWDI